MSKLPSSPLLLKLSLALALLILLGLTSGCSLANPPEPPPEPVFIPSQDTPVPAPSPTASQAPETNPAPAIPPAEPTPEPLGLPETWLWTVNQPDRSLLRVDLQTGQVSALPLKGELGPLAAGEGAVWLAQSLTNGEQNLLRVDPVTLEVAAAVPVRQGEITSLAAGEGAVWAGIREPAVDGVSAGGVLRVDPTTNQVNVYLPRSAVAAELSLYDHALWVLEWNTAFSTIDRIDPLSLQVSTLPVAIETASSVQQFKHISVGPSGIWATSVTELAPYIYRVEAQSGSVTTIVPVGGSSESYPVSILSAENAVWVGLSGGKVLHVDPGSGSIQGQVQIKRGISRMRMAAGSLWVENESEAELYQINPLTHQVVSILSTGAKPQPTPTRTPRPKPGEDTCQAEYPSRLKVGVKAYVTDDPPLPNRVRAEPNVKAEILGEVGPGQSMLIVEGPLCIDGWVWWKVRPDGQDLEGWTSEGKKGEYWLMPVE